jgi:hypothetical protein
MMALEPEDRKDPKRAHVVLPKGHEVVDQATRGWQVLLQRLRTRKKIRVTTARLTGLARHSSITQVRLTGLAKTATWTGKQIGLAGLARLAELPGLAQAAARIRKQEVPVMLLTRKSGLWRIRLTRKARLRKILETWKAGLYNTRGQETGRRKRCCSKQKASFTVVSKGYYQDTKMLIAKDVSKRVR